ncbi:glutathione s-transferase chloride channel [Fusarium sporotrichioides]|uniref:Glutathione s-transferase chloride channel n=1 Tax=Fusarium sporotrichioides TaxID=5514 RepID=A0A395SK41_FUSSP|nr:glutathione s-transferase chloride channel [Fusarium sporotrichioides]
MSALKPITVYAHSAGPNPFKVTIVLEELAVPYTKVVVDNPKEDWFVAINPNGRLPAIKDPNIDIVLWESGAIVEYLVETYDNDGKLCGTSPSNKWEIKQYLHFQMSGQGPYYGQAMWFHKCPQDIPLAKERYVGEIIRVIGVLDNILEGKKYLVDGKLTYADLAFVPWNRVISQHPAFETSLWKKHDIVHRYPNFSAWHERLNNLPSVQAAYK